MGVCFCAYTLSDANIERLLADPPLIWKVVDTEDDSAYLAELQKQSKVSWLAKLLGRAPPAVEAPGLDLTEHELRPVDLDKSWDCLRVCLEACAPDAPSFFEGRGQVGRIEVGYGPALYVRSAEMARIAEAYAGVSEAQLLAAYRSLDLGDVYPKGLWTRRDEDTQAYLTENMAELQAFVQHAQAHALGAILQFT